MDRSLYIDKINEALKKAGAKYTYKKNDENIYNNLIKYGPLEQAKNNAKRIHNNFKNTSPSKAESCTTVYKFFDKIDEWLQEIN